VGLGTSWDPTEAITSRDAIDLMDVHLDPGRFFPRERMH
jgi:hypothetical protein